MNFVELLQQLEKKDSRWFRPKSWIGLGLAMCLKPDLLGDMLLCTVPAPEGPKPFSPKRVKLFLENWDFVDPEVVLDELGEH